MQTQVCVGALGSVFAGAAEMQSAEHLSSHLDVDFKMKLNTWETVETYSQGSIESRASIPPVK